MQQGQPTVIYVTTTPGNTVPVGNAPIQANTKWRNKPQTNATAAGGVIFLSGGMNLALGVGWTQGIFLGVTKHFCYSWFIAVIIGTVLSVPLRNFISKKIIMAVSTLFILIGGILFTSDPYDYDTIMAGRYFNGIAIGLALVPFLMNASEIADATYRGACLSVEQYSMSMGIAIQMIYASYWDQSVDFPANRLHGILDIIYGLLAAASLVSIVESPVDLVRKGSDDAALESLARLRRPQYVTMETHALLEQHKVYVREQENLTMVESLTQGLLPLIKMLFFRSMMLTFCFSMPLNMTVQYTTLVTGATWAPTVAALFRIIGGFIAICLVDNVNRKLPSVFSVLVIGCFLIGLGPLFQYISSLTNYDDMNSAMYLYMFLQLFAGFFVPYTSIFIGEAFPMRVKPLLMAVVIIVEQILHIIFIDTITVYIGDNLMSQGIITVVVFLILCITIPETRNTTLAEAQNRFKKLFYFM